MTTIHDAIKEGDVEKVRTLIASGCDINAQDSFRRTPLHLASWKGNEDIVNILLTAKANTTIKGMGWELILYCTVSVEQFFVAIM